MQREERQTDGERQSGQEMGELMWKFSLKLVLLSEAWAASAYLSSTYSDAGLKKKKKSLPHRTSELTAPFCKDTQIFLQRFLTSVFSLFSKEESIKWQTFSGWCKSFILPPQPFNAIVWSTRLPLTTMRAVMKITETHWFTLFNQPYLCQKIMRSCVFMGFVTFLIKERINMLTFGFIIITNGIFRTQKRVPLHPSVASITSTPDSLWETFNQCWIQ